MKDWFEVDPNPKPEKERLINSVVITAGLVAFLGMLSNAFSIMIFWIVGFGCVNYAFQRVKKDWLRLLIRVIAQIAFIALLLWFKDYFGFYRV
jgi:uncharacterized protein YqhQ